MVSLQIREDAIDRLISFKESPASAAWNAHIAQNTVSFQKGFLLLGWKTAVG